MCGILAIATPAGRALDLDDAAVSRLRDTLAHRGPDAAGLWRDGHVALAHRRLIVIDPSSAAGQPMHSADGRLTLVYNGELYNEPELRAELRDQPFRTASDTETLLTALQQWGAGAPARLRGMYAFALYDARERTILAARDPLGIKPLYYWSGPTRSGPTLILASEIPAILAHPDVPRRPDMVGVSTYITTIRTVLGERTMFEGVRAVRPGQVLRFDLGADAIRVEDAAPRRAPGASPHDAGPAEAVRAALEDSVRRHLRSDVPICCLLSGGVDSTIVATIAQRATGDLFTYCAGARAGTATAQDDFASARLVASVLRTRHAEAPITRSLFRERWAEMVSGQGVPLSTPNEVAINEVARRLRADGRIVTISGEGADELFAGYEGPMMEAAGFEARLAPEHGARPSDQPSLMRRRARFQLDSNAWAPLDAKPALLAPGIWRALESDHALVDTYEREFLAAADDGPGDDPLQVHLRFHRRVNLVGLLQRLDTATMLAGVEGRTPFADVSVAALAESLPMSLKFRAGARAETKRVLREAFAGAVPAEVLARPKASFPLPFESWIADHAGELRGPGPLTEWFRPEALGAVAADAPANWRYAWPLINVALWSRRWWG